ncbi:12687_t:CDS:1, partial [Funneliformis caledonium]
VSGSHDTFGENINSIGIPDHLTNRHIIRSANHNVENSYICYDSIGSNGAFIDNGGGSYGYFNDSIASLDNCNNTSNHLINHQIARSPEPNDNSLSQRTIGGSSSSGGNVDYD